MPKKISDVIHTDRARRLETKKKPMPIPLIDPSQATTNERLTRLEAIAEEHTKALAEIKAHIVRLEDHLHKSFRWLIGLMFLAWVSTIVTILLKID